MGLGKKLKKLYENIVKSADRSSKGGGRSSQRKKKSESSSQKSKGTRGSGVSSSSRSSSSSSGSSSRSSGSSSGSNRPSNSSNNNRQTSAGTRKTGSGAISRGGTSAHRGGYTPGTSRAGKTSSGAIKTKAQERREAAQKASEKAGSKVSISEASKEREKSRKKLQSGYGKDNGPKKTALGTWQKEKEVKYGPKKASKNFTPGVGDISPRSVLDKRKTKYQAEEEFNNRLPRSEAAKLGFDTSMYDKGQAIVRKKAKKAPEADQYYVTDNKKKTKKEYVAEELRKKQDEDFKQNYKARQDYIKENSGTYKYKEATMEDYLKYMTGSRARTKDGKIMVDKKALKNMTSATVGGMARNTASKATTGFIQGASPVDVIHGSGLEYTDKEKKVIKDVINSKAYERGYMGGFMAQFLFSGAGAMGQAVGKSAIKGAAKLAGKEVGKEFAGSAAKKKAKQFAANRLGETIAETPINVADAIKMSTDENGKIDKKALGTYLAMNAGMTAIGGAAPDIIGNAWSNKQTKKFLELQNKKNVGKITAEEASELRNLTAKLRDKAKAENTLSGISARSTLKGNTLGNAAENRIARKIQQNVAKELKAQGASDDVIKSVSAQRAKEAVKSGQVQDYLATISKGGTKVGPSNAAYQALSKSELKNYTRLKERQRIGAITKEETKQLQAFDARVKEARTMTEETLKTVVSDAKNIVNTVSVEDINRLSHAKEYFNSAGMKAEAKEAKKALNHAVNVAKKQNDDVVKAVAIMTKKTGINYRLASGKEIAKMTGGRASKSEDINGFVRTNPETGKLEVVVNRESPQATQTILGHETAHVIKSGSDADFKDLAKSLRDYAESIGELEDFEKSMKENYPEFDLDTKEGRAALDEEITCELLGKYVFGENNDFINRLDPSLARRIVEYVKELMGKVDNPGMSAQLKEIADKVEESIGKIDVDNAAKNADETRYAKTFEESKENFIKQIDAWDGKTEGFSFNVGETSQVLQSIGLKKQRISMDASKLKGAIYGKHKKNMSKNVVKGIPDLLEDPIVIAQSKKPEYESRIIVAGELYDEFENPVTAVLELMPTSRKGATLDIVKVASLEGRGHIKSVLPMEKLIYINPDVKKTDNWLNVNRVQFPLRSSNYGLIRRITYDDGKIKLEDVDNTNAGAEDLKLSKTRKTPEAEPENPLFREWKDLDAELKELNKKDFTPEAEKRSDEIISRIDEISRELGGGRVTKENADEALKAIEAQRASDETLVKNNEETIKNSDDELAGLERPTPDSGEMPKGLKANKKASRPIKDRVQETLNSQKYGKQEFTKAEQKDIDKSFETISNRIANGDDAGAKADAEALVEKHFRFDTEEREIDPNYKEKRKELKDIQRYLKNHAWEMPEGSARNLNEFLEYIGLPKNMTHLLPIRRWNLKASTLGKKGAYRKVINKGGKTPRAQIDDQWTTLSKEWPDYFPPETGGVEDRFRKMVDAVMLNAEDVFPESKVVNTLSDAEIAEYKEFKVDEIIDLARENAGTYKGIDEPAPLKPLADDMGEDELTKVINGQKKHLENAIKKYGEDAPRVKEIKDYIADAEKRIDAVRGETKTKPVKPKKAESKPEVPKEKPIGFDEVEEDVRKSGIKSDAEVEASKAGQKTNNSDAKPKRQVPSGIQKLADAKDSVVRQWVSSLYGIEKEAMKAGDKQLLNQTTKVYLTKNKLSAFIQQKRTNLDGKITGDGLDAIYEKAGLFGKKNKEKKADFTNYLLYKHAIDRLDAGKPVHMGEDGASLYTKEQYQELIDDIAGKYKERGELGQLEQFEKGMRGYYDNLMQYRVDAGLVTKDFADALKEKYPNYVPTYREGDEWMEGALAKGENHQASIGQTIGVATGGREPIEDLYSQTVKRTEDVLKNAEENVMLNMFAKAKGFGPGAIPKGATIEEVSEAAISVHKGHDGGWRVTFFNDGEPVTMACDKIVAQGLKEFNGTDYSTMMNAFTKMSSNKVTNTIGTNFKHLITDWNIMFGIRNGARDFQQALVNSKNTRAYCKSIPQAYASIARSMTGQESAYMKLYQANGGRYSALVRQDKKFVEPGMEKIPKGLKAPIRALEAANSAIEMGPRMCEFIGTLNKHANDILKKDGSSVKQLRKEMMEDMYPGKTAKQLTADEIDEFEEKVANRIVDLCGKDAVDEAMRNSADITLNFSRAGVMGKTLNSGLVPYLNPSLQGLSKTVRLFTEGRADKALLNLGMKLGTFTIAPAVLNEVLMKDNRDYQNLNTREKDSNFFISIGDGKFIKVPKPRENAVLAEPVEYGLRYFFDKAQVGVIEKGEYSGEKMFQMWDSAWDNIGPVNPLTDNIISPLVRLWQNKTWYGGSIDSISDTIALRDGETKHSEVYDEKTSALAIEIGNKKIGGKTISDRFKLSPKKIDDLMDSYLGMIYDLGVLSYDKTRPEVGTGNPFINQFVKDSVFSNKTGTELWEEFAKLNAPKTTGGKILQAGKDAVLGNNKYNITDKTIEAQDWLNQKGYDDMTYSSAVLHFQTSKDFKGKKKEDLIRNAKIAQNTFRHDLAYGDGIVTPKMDPIRKLAGMVGVDYAMEKLTYTYVDPETGEKKNQHLDAWRAYKKSDEYKNDPKKADKKFIDFYSKMRWTNGMIGESKSFPSWMTASVLAATEKGKNDDLAKAYIRPDFDEDGEYTKKIIQRGKNYRDYGFTQGYYRKSQRTLFKAGRSLEYEYTNKMNPWDKAMALSTAKKNYADGAYYSADTDGKVSRRMNYARYLNKTDHTTKEIYDFADKYNLELPKFDYENTTAKERGEGWRAFNKKVEAAVNKEYKDATDAVKAAVYHVITDDTYNKPFGDIPDMTQKNDTGITELDERENKGKGRGRRRGRRGRRGGGGGGSGGGGEVPNTASGAIKATTTKSSGPKASRLGKITDPFSGSVSDVTTKSNLDNAYRKRLKKLREKSRKH